MRFKHDFVTKSTDCKRTMSKTLTGKVAVITASTEG